MKSAAGQRKSCVRIEGNPSTIGAGALRNSKLKSFRKVSVKSFQ